MDLSAWVWPVSLSALLALVRVTHGVALRLAQAAVVSRCEEIDVSAPDFDSVTRSLHQDDAGQWLIQLREVPTGRWFWVKIPAGGTAVDDVLVEVHIPRQRPDRQ